MKKYLLPMLILICSISYSYAQSFEITPQSVYSKSTLSDQIILQSTNLPEIIGLRHGGTIASPLATGSGSNLIRLLGRGHNGTGFTPEKAGISMITSETWNATSNGTYMQFTTTASGTTSNLERMRLSDAGNLGIGATTPLTKLHVRQAASGAPLNGNASVFIEDNSSNYLQMGSPEANENGVLFSKPSSSASGGIIYTGANALNLRTGGNINRMIIASGGDVGIGSVAPDFPLHVTSTTGMSNSTSGAFAIGSTAGTHLNFDNNEINAWTGTSGSTLYLNFWSNAKVQVGNGTSGNLDVNGFSNLGDGAPAIKMKKFAGSIPLNATTHSIAHGLTKTKILGLQIFVESSVTGNRYLPNDGAVGSVTHYEIQLDNTNIQFQNIGANLDGEPYIIVVTYEQ